MRENNCEVVRRELDELTMGEACSTAATEHLRDCASCREFYEQQTKLRQIVGSLGTVEAPAARSRQWISSLLAVCATRVGGRGDGDVVRDWRCGGAQYDEPAGSR